MRDKTKYIAYIHSPEWQEKRKQVFAHKWYKCEACWITEWLHIHHWTYRRLFKEEISDLFVLCSYCHMALHDKYWTKDLYRATKAFIEWMELIPRKKKKRLPLEQRRKNKAKKNKKKKKNKKPLPPYTHSVYNKTQWKKYKFNDFKL